MNRIYRKLYTYFCLVPLASLKSWQLAGEEDQGRTDSKVTFRNIKDWIRDCDNHHDYCRSLISNHGSLWIPSRLIFVGTTATPALRLCEDAPQGSQYTSLSHCWGGYMPLRLLKCNLASFKKELPISALPKTFRDSIIVTRQLDILYIWIDSLCIVQDSADDWEKESVLMYKVYSNASMNVAATFARDGRDGLFSERHQLAVQPCIVEVDWLLPDTTDSVEEESHMNIHANAKYFYQVVPNSRWERKVEESPLNQRGWVCQERLLSRRNVHFTQGEVYWECASTSASELRPQFHKETRWFTEIKMKLASRMQNHTLSSKKSTETRNFEYFMAWADIVQQYTSCDLTYDSDKLPAIAGLAQHWQALWGSEVQYLAGLWNMDLPYQLLWIPKKPNVREIQYTWTRPQVYIAPTWSWASVRGPISYVRIASSEPNEVMVTINDIRTVDASNSRFGQITEGQISVSCRLAQVVVAAEAGNVIRLGVDSDPMIFFDYSTIWIDHNGLVGNGAWLIRNVFFMPILKEFVGGTAPKEAELYGILLQEVSGMKGIFQRCGCCIVRKSSISALYDAFDLFDGRGYEKSVEYSRNEADEILYHFQII